MKKPPKIARWILSITNRKRNREDILGDFAEFYEEISKSEGIATANIWYWKQAIKSIPNFIKSSIYWGVVMFISYLKIAWRSIQKHIFSSAINVVGLALGMACCLLMLLWVNDEFNFDSFHENGNEIYRVISEIHSTKGISVNARTPNALGPVLKDEFPEIVDFIRYQGYENWFIKANDKTFNNTVFGTAEPEFFNMFTFPFVKGNPKEALNNPSSIVITESMALKYFGESDPMGKTVNIMSEGFTVTGIIKDIPQNSHLQFDCMIPVSNIERFNHQDFTSWESMFFYTYIQTSKNVSKQNLEEKIYNLLNKRAGKSEIKLLLQPMADVHLLSDFESDNDNYSQGNIQYVYIFIVMALCILLVACINYMNLSTAKSSNRAKEVGMRKVIGASRFNIGIQFIGESLMLCVFALILSVGILYVSLPLFNEFTGKNLILDFISSWYLVLSLIVVTIVTGLLSGSYPAFFISSLKPIKALKSVNELNQSRRGLFRKVLVITQFVFTVVLLVISLTMHSQLDFLRNKNLGYNKNHVIHFTDYTTVSIEVLGEELLKYPGILNVSFSNSPARRYSRLKNEISWEGKNPDDVILTYTLSVDPEYLNTFQIELKEGRFYSKEMPTDRTNFVLNETAVKKMGFSSPIGTKLTYNNPYYGVIEGNIIGVVKDYHQTSLHNPIEPMVFLPVIETRDVCIRVNPNDISGSINHMESLWKKYANPDYPFVYEFVDEAINKFYAREQKIGSAFTIFTSLTLIIACLGLIGLASFMTEKRTKEISIRKVLGATVSGVSILISREFIKWVLIANIIAFPLAYILVEKWLGSFAYKVGIDPWIFIYSGVFSIMLALLTVMYHAVKAAFANPIDSIKYE